MVWLGCWAGESCWQPERQFLGQLQVAMKDKKAIFQARTHKNTGIPYCRP
jgi:uncharacterized protein (DUF2461 family)